MPIADPVAGMARHWPAHARTPLALTPAFHMHTHTHLPRSFRAVHEEVVKLDQDFGATFSGVLTDEAGRVRALWGSYAEQVR